MIVDKKQAKRYLDELVEVALDDYVNSSLKDNELPMSKEALEEDFRNFLIGYLESDTKEEDAQTIS